MFARVFLYYYYYYYSYPKLLNEFGLFYKTIIIIVIVLTTSLFQYMYAPDNKRFMAEELS